MRWRSRLPLRALLSVVAVGTLLAATAVLLAPDRFGALSSFADTARPVVSLAAFVVGVLGLLFVLRLPSLGSSDDTLDIDDAAPVDRGDPLGHEIDAALDTYSETHEWERIKSRRLVRERLSAAVVYVLVGTEGCSEAEARRRLARGTWTDDPIAASFLADEGEVVLPLRTRLEEWLKGDRFARHARTVITALSERSSQIRLPDDSLARRSSRGGERTHAVRIRADGGER
ncbi:hypothetical protein ACFPYI_06775 [Halomarina salina]|uniref:Uncharacterized protein n=1 Tax=Halomarina salina TaxID=1872699 RepID=A0ABD5RKX1_9EURY|nr:hypothetical protein [Halomarina salina]